MLSGPRLCHQWHRRPGRPPVGPGTAWLRDDRPGGRWRGAPIPHAAERDSDPTKRKSRSVGQPDCDSPRLAGRRCPRTGPRSFSGIAGRPQTAAPPPVGKARPGCAPLRVLSDPDSLAPYFECSVLFPKKAQSFFVPYPSPTAKAGRRRLSAPPPLRPGPAAALLPAAASSQRRRSPTWNSRNAPATAPEQAGIWRCQTRARWGARDGRSPFCLPGVGNRPRWSRPATPDTASAS